MEEDLFSLKANHEDISSYSNFDRIRQEKIRINATICFKTKRVFGSVDITFSVVDKEEMRVILDTKQLQICEVKNKLTGKVLKWYLYDENPDKEALGTPLIILLEKDMGGSFELTIEFCATEESAAIQWLEPVQTLGKVYPFMFTQCEAILARTLLPCQDTPSAKVVVEANLTVEKPIRALFSGIEKNITEEGDLVTYQYIQEIPIPTYLIAIACGELEFGKLSERCGVWTEVGLKDKAVWEFANTEDFLKTAESYLTPYVWGVYNILVLPFAFPYGGMENPCLTFVTPALIAGDRSMTNVIAHEIAHSWTGNLVTNKNWANFWMNEGFTTFMERKISELMYGEEMSNLEASVGKDELKSAIESFGEENNFTSLAPDFTNINPDDAFSVVPYEKGATFLYFLETLVGKSNFQKILQKYITKFALKSISHHDFRFLFEEEVRSLYGEKAEDEILSKIHWEKWITTPGQPIINFNYESKWNTVANDLAERFLTTTIEENAKETFTNWHTNVKLVFLGYLNHRCDQIDDKVYVNLRDKLNLHEGGYNAEVKHLWFQIALKTKHQDVVEHVKSFLLSHGRMKYIRPVYYAWFAFNKEECLDFFDKNKFIYHSVAARLIEKKFSELNN